jgi:autotransporter-associated beta strand protein
LNIKSESGPALTLNFASPTHTTALGFNVPYSLTGTIANEGGVTLLAAAGAAGTGEVSLGGTASPFNLGAVQRIFDIAPGNDANTYDLRTRGPLSGAGGITKNGAGHLRLDGTSSAYTGATIVDAGVMDVNNSSFRTSSSLTVADGARFAMRPRDPLTPSDPRVLQVGTLNLNNTGTLDLNDNDLVVDNGDFATIFGQVLAGFGNPAGPGITSSTSTGVEILALFDNAQVGAGDWEGGTIGANAVVGKYTYFGDVNIDGQVSGDDYTIIDSNLDTDPPVGLEWLSGDANLDGIVTGDDYTIIDSNLGLGSGSPLTASSLSADFGELSRAVPEPGSLGLLFGAAALLSRRRRRPVN